MRLIAIALVFAFVGISYGENAVEGDSPTSETYKVAREFGYTNGKEIQRLNKVLKKKINTEAISQDIMTAFQRSDIEAAEKADIALQNLLARADGVLRNKGEPELADEIAYEYQRFYEFGFTKKALGIKEIGDHPPMSEWLDTVHTKIEDAIGNFFCEYFHFHDIYILNHGLPVVFNPKKYDLKDYLDHFSGHLIWGFWWEHHGVAGVVTYWVVEGICAASTSGVGIAVFACGPIAGLAEHVMDKRIAPPIATRIWDRYN